MSVMWDELGQKLYGRTLTNKDIGDLEEFLIYFDNVHDNIVLRSVLSRHGFDYWTDFDIALHSGLVSRETLGQILSDLHSFDHENDEILMRSFYKNKNYWRNHKIYKTVLGTFRKGKWEKK